MSKDKSEDTLEVIADKRAKMLRRKQDLLLGGTILSSGAILLLILNTAGGNFSFKNDSLNPRITPFLKYFKDKDKNPRLIEALENLGNSIYSKLDSFLDNKKNSDFAYFYPERLGYALALPKEEQEQFIVDFMELQPAHERLLHHVVDTRSDYIIRDYSRNDAMLRHNLQGPWNIDPKYHQLMKDLGGNIHLDPLLKYLSLHDLSDHESYHPIIYADLISNFQGIANNNFEVVISNTIPENSLKSITMHELTHRVMLTQNRGSNFLPYNLNDNFPTGDDKIHFKTAMERVLITLHDRYFPEDILPPTLKSIIIKLGETKVRSNIYISSEYNDIVNIISSLRHYHDTYLSDEFVAIIPEIIAAFDGIPTPLRDDFAPITEYYKKVITPKCMDYIEQHPRKSMLLENEMDRYHPETLLSASGEERLLTKKKLTKDEKILVSQMSRMEKLIREENIEQIRTYSSNLQDERVVRASLQFCIKYNNLAAFNEISPLIQAPQYLGPQLLLASHLNRTEMLPELRRNIVDEYYLMKATELPFSNTSRILESHDMIARSLEHQTQELASTNFSLKEIIPQVIVAGALVKAVHSLGKKIFGKNKTEDNLETKDLDKKLQSLHNQFKLLEKKRVEKYKNSPSEKLLEEINHFRSLQEQALNTIDDLTKLNKTKGLNKKELKTKTTKIFNSYKQLEKEKLHNTRNVTAAIKAAKQLKESGLSLSTSKTGAMHLPSNKDKSNER